MNKESSCAAPLFNSAFSLFSRLKGRLEEREKLNCLLICWLLFLFASFRRSHWRVAPITAKANKPKKATNTNGTAKLKDNFLSLSCWTVPLGGRSQTNQLSIQPPLVFVRVVEWVGLSGWSALRLWNAAIMRVIVLLRKEKTSSFL